jgi:hypothetical protein
LWNFGTFGINMQPKFEYCVEVNMIKISVTKYTHEQKMLIFIFYMHNYNFGPKLFIFLVHTTKITVAC